MKPDQKTGIPMTMSAIRKLHRDIALLLETVDAFIFDRRWESLGENVAHEGTSRHIRSVDRWMPTLFFRIYKSDEFPSLRAFVSITIDDLNGLFETDNPLICVGFIDYGQGNKPTATGFQWTDLRITKWHEEGQNKFGDELEVTDSNINNNRDGANRIRYIHHPLTSIVDKESLNKLILEPFAAMLENQRNP